MAPPIYKNKLEHWIMAFYASLYVYIKIHIHEYLIVWLRYVFTIFYLFDPYFDEHSIKVVRINYPRN